MPASVELKKCKEALNVLIIPAVTEDRLTKICKRIYDSKAPGLDAVPNRALTLAVETRFD